MDIINPYIHGEGASPAAFDGFGNRSRSFDGVDDYVTIPDNPSLPTGAQTISAWVKTENFGDYADIVSQWDNAGEAGFVILKLQDNQIAFYITNTGSTAGNGSRFTQTGSGNTINVGSWYHVSCVFDPSTSIKIYINGILASTNSNSIHSSIYDSGNDLFIGERADVANRNWHGNIADVRIYDTDLTATEISDLYNGTNITTNLVGHWLTDADNVLDAAGSNNGTNYGTKYSYDNPSPPVEFGSASRSFDGVDDTINLGQITDNAIFSVSSWFKLNTVNSNGSGIIGKWHNNTSASWLLYVRSASASGNMTFIVRNGADNGHFILDSGVSASSLIGEWTHIAAVADGNNLTMYINGVSVASTTYDGTINNPASDAHIGSYNADLNNNHRTNGNIADVRIYDTDLTASQISDLYSGTDVQTNLVGHWLTDNDDVEDKAGTNDGTNFGSTYSYDNPPMDLIPSRQASRDFSGLSQHVEMSDVVSIGTGSLSWSCWLNADSIANTRTIVRMGRSSSSGNARYDGLQILLVNSKIGGYLLDYNNSGSLFSVLNASNAVEGKWHHAVVSLDANAQTLELFVDGVSEGSVSVSSIHPWDITAQDPPSIGAREIPDGNFTADEFDGKIADVRLYDSGLTSTEVLAIYNGTTDRTNLVGQWLTNSDDVVDHAGTNDGINNGTTYSTDSPS